MLPRTERETSAHYIWLKRGTTVGELARIYCREGSPHERWEMMEAIRDSSTLATVTIVCREPHEHP